MSLKIHIYFFLMVAYEYACGKLVPFLVFYGFTILHELAHIVMTYSLRKKVSEIVLLPFGVNAKYKEALLPKEELWISLAGPLASFLLAFFLPHTEFQMMNVVIGAFNLIPVYPMDGGRILKSILVLYYSHVMGKVPARKKTWRIVRKINEMMLLTLFVFSMIGMFFYHNYYLLCFTWYFIFLAKDEIQKEQIFEQFNYLQKQESIIN